MVVTSRSRKQSEPSSRAKTGSSQNTEREQVRPSSWQDTTQKLVSASSKSDEVGWKRRSSSEEEEEVRTLGREESAAKRSQDSLEDIDHGSGNRQQHSPIMTEESSAKLPASPLVTPPGGRAVPAREENERKTGDSHGSNRRTDEDKDSKGIRRKTWGSEETVTSSTGSPSSTGKRGVPHVYHDYSQVPDAIGYVRKKTGGVTQPFPEKLHEMLNAVEMSPETKSIVSWLPHGRAFLVHKPKEFTKTIMPKFFRQTKLTSFQRQLNLYGFRRITQGSDAGAYYHEMFLRGRAGLCQRMVRQKVKGTGHKQPADASSEPNFYFMPSLDEGQEYDYESTEAPKLETASPVAMPPEQILQPSVEAEAPSTPRSYPAHGFSLAAAPASTLNSPMSPGMQSVRGAANLLRGIASGMGFSRPFLGPAAGEEVPLSGTDFSRSSPWSDSKQQSRQQGGLKPASFLPELDAEHQESV